MKNERRLAVMTIKWGLAVIVLTMLVFFGFTFRLQERYCALVLRFGAPRAEVMAAGLHWRLPWPFEDVKIYDGRLRYQDSGYLETLTRDKKNIIMQTWTTWRVADPLKFYVSVGNDERAAQYLSDLATDAKNSVMGNYDLSALVSMTSSDIRIPQIEAALLRLVSAAARQYGVDVTEVKIRRLGFPSSNMASVLNQMTADRQKLVVQLAAEGARDAAAIRGKADVEAADIRAQARQKAAAIAAQSEKEVAAVYANAHKQDPGLYEFLTKLRVLSASLDDGTVLVMRADEPPFDVLAKPSTNVDATKSFGPHLPLIKKSEARPGRHKP